MFEDPLCSLSKSLGIHGVDTTRPHGHARVCAYICARPCGHAGVLTDACARPRGRECFTPGNFITDAIVCPSHGRPSGHRLTVRLSVRYRLRNNPGIEGNHLNYLPSSFPLKI
jgi:hypothetical protein